MTDLALQVAGSKLAISIALGAVVWLVARGNERPRLCHALCLTLLAALLIPPLIALPMLSPAAPAPSPAAGMTHGAIQSAVLPGEEGGGGFMQYGGLGLILAWILGGAAMIGWTIARARAVRGSLGHASRGPCPDLQGMAREIGHTLGLARVPTIETTDAIVSPMVYWSGGTVRVLIPSALIQGMERSQLRWILAHELAHVRRRDHLVRWLEWLACAVFWWNPVAWWARRRLRAAGEVCCDALVLKVFGCAPRDYARSLIRALDLVRTGRASRTPALASAAQGGRRTRDLERRLRMIITNRSAANLPPALRTVVRGGIVILLAFGLVYCSEQTSPTAVEVPDIDAPLINLTPEDLEVIEVPPAESMAPGPEAGEPPDGYKMTGTTYGELVDTFDGLQTFYYGRSGEPAANLGSVSCAACHAGGTINEDEAVPLKFRANLRSTAGGGWRVDWEIATIPHADPDPANPGTSGAATILKSQWLPPGTIERIVVDRPPPPRR